MVFSKKKAKEKEAAKIAEETAAVPEIDIKPPEPIRQAKLLIDLTEPERFVHLYNELCDIKTLLAELVEIAKSE